MSLLDLLQSEQINEITGALVKAQSQIAHALVDSENPHFRSTYASLESVIDAIKLPLSENGIAVVQQPVVHEGAPLLITTLAHISGQWMRSFTPIVSEKQTAQAMGSGLSYARRYSLEAFLLIGEKDDDGNEASAPSKGPVVVNSQHDNLFSAFSSLGVGRLEILKKMKVSEPAALTQKQLDELRSYHKQISSKAVSREKIFGTRDEIDDALGSYVAPDFESRPKANSGGNRK